MRINKDVKYGVLLSGFSYLEVVVALMITSMSVLGLMQMTLQQTTSASKLSVQLQSQLLQLDIQNRIEINKTYIHQWQQAALYFNPNIAKAQNCGEQSVSKCYITKCNGNELAALDVHELSCKASDMGLIHKMDLQPSSALSSASEIVISIWLTPEVCISDNCKLVEHRLWL